MLLFHADDYGINISQAERILACRRKGRLNSVSLLVNSPEAGQCAAILPKDVRCRLHLNFREGKCLSDPRRLPLLTDREGRFKLSFGALLLLSVLRKRELERELRTETRSQIERYFSLMGEDCPLRIDSHGHYHMIPLVWDVLLTCCMDMGRRIEEIRIPAEPFGPVLGCRKIWGRIPVSGVIKNLLMHGFRFRNRLLGPHPEGFDDRRTAPLFFGMTFTTRMFPATVRCLLPSFQKLASREGRDLELMFHPGGLKGKEELWDPKFAAFHLSPDRDREAMTLISI